LAATAFILPGDGKAVTRRCCLLGKHQETGRIVRQVQADLHRIASGDEIDACFHQPYRPRNVRLERYAQPVVAQVGQQQPGQSQARSKEEERQAITRHAEGSVAESSTASEDSSSRSSYSMVSLASSTALGAAGWDTLFWRLTSTSITSRRTLR